MDEGRAKVVGPAVAVGAVSLGLIIIGACGVGQREVYVPPPALSADLAVAPSRLPEEPTSTTYRIEIPPSPSWRVAPYMSPRKPFSLSSTETTPPPAEDDEHPESRPPEAAADPRAPATTDDSTAEEPTPTTEPTTAAPTRTTRPVPTRTVPPPTTRAPIEETEVEEVDETEEPTHTPTQAYDRLPTPRPLDATTTAPYTENYTPTPRFGIPTPEPVR